jgi:DNA-binding NarL/FixJ family response regulator
VRRILAGRALRACARVVHNLGSKGVVLVDVLLVDDHALFREGLALLLREVDSSVSVRHAGSVAQALNRLNDSGRPDLILLDMVLPGEQGLDALRTVRSHAEEVPIVVLSGSEDAQLVRDCIEEGAMGFIPKASDSRVMTAALRLVLSGGVYLPSLVIQGSSTSSADSRPAHLGELTPRQREVLLRLVQGKPNKIIARELGISDTTVKTHVSAVLQCLGVHNRTEAVFAMRNLDPTTV